MSTSESPTASNRVEVGIPAISCPPVIPSPAISPVCEEERISASKQRSDGRACSPAHAVTSTSKWAQQS